MQFFNSSYKFAKGILVSLFLLFSMCCFRLCAEDMSPAQAQVARDNFVMEAKKHVGSQYVYGAVGPETFDCSGLIYYCARESVKVQLPRTAKAIYSYCRIVPDSKREVGDLLFFKTTSSGTISHVGIYIGNNQFISAISDGPNSGVIISSLKQDYWKGKYVACGQFLPSGKKSAADEEKFEEELVTRDDSTVAKKSGGSFKDKVVFDANASFGWSLIAPNEFMIKFRGIDLLVNARYTGMNLQPGFGIGLRFNTALGVFQMPLVFSATLNDYVRFYAGPIISFKNGTMINTGDEISPSFFPGLLGMSFSTPAFTISKSKVQVFQDISYSVWNNPDNAALSFVDSLSAGLVFYTGVRVTLPLSAFSN